MIYNGKEYLPLEEAVQELVRLVEGHYSVDRVIADFGITMVNQPVPDPSYLDGVKGTQWGEAYPVGYRSPYDIYIWTRPTADTTNVNDGTWFNVGPLAIPGPQGPKGEQGEQGERGHSTRWYFGDSVTEVASPMPGDVFMNSEGLLFMYDELQGWGLPLISIRGPQGPQGPQGKQGTQGPQGEQGTQGPIGISLPSIVLIGKLTSVDLLPSPSASYVGRGYIVTTNEINTIYTVFEDENQSGQYSWNIAGTVSGFSIITAGGVVVPQFDADSKLDKETGSTTYNQVYVKAANGGQGTINITKQVVADAAVQRQSDGNIYVPTSPVENTDAASKKYVDDSLTTKLDIRRNTTVYPQLYQKSTNGSQSMRDLIQDVYGTDTWDAHGYSVAQRDNYGAVRGPNPNENNQYTPKQYVEAHFSHKLYQHNMIVTGRGPDSDDNMWYFGIAFSYTSSQSNPITNYLGIYNVLSQNGTQPILFFPYKGVIDGETIIRATLNSTGWIFEVGDGVGIHNTYNVLFNNGSGSVEDTVNHII